MPAAKASLDKLKIKRAEDDQESVAHWVPVIVDSSEMQKQQDSLCMSFRNFFKTLYEWPDQKGPSPESDLQQCFRSLFCEERIKLFFKKRIDEAEQELRLHQSTLQLSQRNKIRAEKPEAMP